MEVNISNYFHPLGEKRDDWYRTSEKSWWIDTLYVILIFSCLPNTMVWIFFLKCKTVFFRPVIIQFSIFSRITQSLPVKSMDHFLFSRDSRSWIIQNFRVYLIEHYLCSIQEYSNVYSDTWVAHPIHIKVLMKPWYFLKQ